MMSSTVIAGARTPRKFAMVALPLLQGSPRRRRRNSDQLGAPPPTNPTNRWLPGRAGTSPKSAWISRPARSQEACSPIICVGPVSLLPRHSSAGIAQAHPSQMVLFRLPCKAAFGPRRRVPPPVAAVMPSTSIPARAAAAKTSMSIWASAVKWGTDLDRSSAAGLAEDRQLQKQTTAALGPSWFTFRSGKIVTPAGLGDLFQKMNRCSVRQAEICCFFDWPSASWALSHRHRISSAHARSRRASSTGVFPIQRSHAMRSSRVAGFSYRFFSHTASRTK